MIYKQIGVNPKKSTHQATLAIPTYLTFTPYLTLTIHPPKISKFLRYNYPSVTSVWTSPPPQVYSNMINDNNVPFDEATPNFSQQFDNSVCDFYSFYIFRDNCYIF